MKRKSYLYTTTITTSTINVKDSLHTAASKPHQCIQGRCSGRVVDCLSTDVSHCPISPESQKCLFLSNIFVDNDHCRTQWKLTRRLTNCRHKREMCTVVTVPHTDMIKQHPVKTMKELTCQLKCGVGGWKPLISITYIYTCTCLRSHAWPPLTAINPAVIPSSSHSDIKSIIPENSFCTAHWIW